jgi:hypothetical protein
MSLNDPTPNTANAASLSPGFSGADLTASSKTVRVGVRNVTSVQIAVRDTSGGTLDVSIDFRRNDGSIVSSLGPADVLQGVTDGDKEVYPRGAEAVVVFENGTGATSVNASVTTD